MVRLRTILLKNSLPALVEKSQGRRGIG